MWIPEDAERRILLMHISQISMVMDKFESQFADLDVQTSYMESTMSDTTALATPQDQVDHLIDQVADEAGLEVRQGLGEAQVPAAVPKETESESKVAVEEDGRLAQRLRALRVSQFFVRRCVCAMPPLTNFFSPPACDLRHIREPTKEYFACVVHLMRCNVFRTTLLPSSLISFKSHLI